MTIFVMCGEPAPRDPAVVCLEEIVGMFVDSCVNDVNFSEAADAIDDIVAELALEVV